MKQNRYMYRPSDYSVYVQRDDGLFVHGDCSDGESMRGFDESLLKHYGFIDCDESDLPSLKEKKDEHYAFLSWQCRSDGHGGIKGGTLEEYREHVARKSTPKFSRDLHYEGCTDPTVNAIKDELDAIEAKKKQLQEQLKKIQNNCEHDYRFWCTGMYEDTYICTKCDKTKRQ